MPDNFLVPIKNCNDPPLSTLPEVHCQRRSPDLLQIAPSGRYTRQIIYSCRIDYFTRLAPTGVKQNDLRFFRKRGTYSTSRTNDMDGGKCRFVGMMSARDLAGCLPMRCLAFPVSVVWCRRRTCRLHSATWQKARAWMEFFFCSDERLAQFSSPEACRYKGYAIIS